MPRRSSREGDSASRPRAAAKNAQRKDWSALTITLVIVGALGGMTILVCCGIGGIILSRAQRQIGYEISVDKERVRATTNELAEITIPSVFQPHHTSHLAGINTVRYSWCPGGECLNRTDDIGMLELANITYRPQPGKSDGYRLTDPVELKKTWEECSSSIEERTIRDRKCEFFTIRGKRKHGDAAAPIPAVHLYGEFPGRTEDCYLELILPEESFDEAVVRELLDSIR